MNEALPSYAKVIEIHTEQQSWIEVAKGASNTSELCLTLGKVSKAVEYGKSSIDYADKHYDKTWKMLNCTTYANVLLQKGLPNDVIEARELFIDAERYQQESLFFCQYLYSLQGYRYCQLLLKDAKQDPQALDELIKRVEETIVISKRNNWLLTIAFDQLTLSKAYLLKSDKTNSQRQAQYYLDLAVSGLRKAGRLDYFPSGLLTRANYYTKTHNHTACWRDLDETFEIASFGDMQLHLCDYHLEASRNIAGQLQEKLQSNGPYLVIENGQQLQPSKDEMLARLHRHFNQANTMIDELSYHFRDDDLVEVQGLISAFKL